MKKMMIAALAACAAACAAAETNVVGRARITSFDVGHYGSLFGKALIYVTVALPEDGSSWHIQARDADNDWTDAEHVTFGPTMFRLRRETEPVAYRVVETNVDYKAVAEKLAKCHEAIRPAMLSVGWFEYLNDYGLFADDDEDPLDGVLAYRAEYVRQFGSAKAMPK